MVVFLVVLASPLLLMVALSLEVLQRHLNSSSRTVGVSKAHCMPIFRVIIFYMLILQN